MKSKLFIFYLGFWFIYFCLIWINAIQVRADGWYAAYIPHWADGAAHLSYMASIAFRPTLPHIHPLYLDHPFAYSFAADFLGGLLTKAGVDLPLSYNLIGLLLSLLVVITVWHLFRSLQKSPFHTLLATSLFFFSGGLGWRYYLNREAPPQTDGYFFSLFTQIKDTPIVWLNTIVGELIPQRAFLLGLPLGCLLLYIFIRRLVFHHSFSKPVLILSGVILGFFPLIHPHTAMIIISCLAIYGLHHLIFFPSSRRQTLLDLALIGVPSLLIGSALASVYIFPAVSQGFFRPLPGWLAATTQTNWFLFWFDNWGLFLPLAAIGTLRVSPRLKLVLAPFWLWFILANLFLFQPYDWDNSKLLTWVYLMFTLPVTHLLARLTKTWLTRLILASTIILLCFSGGVDAFRMLNTHQHSLLLLSRQELTLAEYLKTTTSPDSVILTATTHRNWVPIATGRQILCGYRGWMWTYGIDDADRVSDIQAIYRGVPQAPQLIKQYGIDYVIIGPEEQAEFNINQAFFDTHYPMIYRHSDTLIYQIN
jgi:hypothetical protein